MLATFPAVPTGAGITFMVTRDDANGEYVQNMDYSATPQHTTAYIPFTINTPGKYFVRMVNYYDKSQVWATADFAVGEDTVGPRAVGNTAAGQGKVSICTEIDDNWKCAGAANVWKANAPFNVLFENPTPSGVDFIGIVFFKQGPDGKDVEFVNEYQQKKPKEPHRRLNRPGPCGGFSVWSLLVRGSGRVKDKGKPHGINPKKEVGGKKNKKGIKRRGVLTSLPLAVSF